MKKTRIVPTLEDDEVREAVEATMGKKPDKRTKQWKDAQAKGKRQAGKRDRAEAHTTRAQEGRATEFHEMADEPWVRPSTLPFIPPRPGYVQRWIRVSSRGEADATNVSRKAREGWVPRKPETLPKKFPIPTIEHGRFAGCIGVEGMVLEEMPVKRNDQRNAFYAERKSRQTSAINSELAQASRHGHSGFGRIQKAEKTEVGTLREVKVATDE